jgi:hypothetical protein
VFKSTSMLGLVGALVSAGAYATPESSVPAEAIPVPVEAVAEIRRARVELYCGQDARAVADIRAARGRLREGAAGLRGDVVAALDEAAWLARRGRLEAAERALQNALDLLPPGVAGA